MKQLITIVSISCFLSITVYAQKLPNKQEVSIFAPSKVKINGKAEEWGTLQAYNKNTEVYYALANDNVNLYLMIKATKPDVIAKLIGGGVTLTINNYDKKKDRNEIGITFPAYGKHYGNMHFINMKNKPVAVNDTLKNKLLADSFANAINSQLGTIAKMIMITGVKTIPDSLISIYNENGIKAFAHFDKQANYNYKLAMPLKYLPIDIVKAPKFKYNIKLNGASTNDASIQLSSSGRFYMVSERGAPGYVIPVQMAILVYPTDFWGEYTLAKK